MALKYFIHCNFIEQMQRPLGWLPTIGKFNRLRLNLELISVSVLCEDGRRFFAVNNELKPRNVDERTAKIIEHLPWKKTGMAGPVDKEDGSGEKDLRYWTGPNPVYKTKDEIGKSLFEFFQHNDSGVEHSIFIEKMMDYNDDGAYFDRWRETHNALMTYQLTEKQEMYNQEFFAQPELYSYDAHRSWILLYSLYGKPSSVPKGYPEYIKSVRQLFDDTVTEITDRYFSYYSKKGEPIERTYDEMWELNKKSLIQMDDYPHLEKSAILMDADWCKQLYDFVQKYKPSF